MTKYGFSVLIVLVSYTIARYYRNQGYNFWRTFVFSILMFVGLVLIILSALG